MATIGSLVVRIGGDVSGLTGSLQSAQQRVRSFGQSMRSMGSALTMGVSAPIMGIGLAALNSAAEFEQSMNVLQAVSGATELQMASLQAQALALGADTAFSAQEAAAAQLELAKAGMDVNQVMAATSGVLNLAAAGDLAVGAAAEIAANAVNAFGLEAAQAGQIADLLAAAANSSSVEVTDLAQAFNMSAAVASSYGFTIEEVSTALAVMGNNGLKGSDAGTSLKTMFMRLGAPTKKAADLMADLGIEVYNSAGEMNSMGAILASVEKGTMGLSEAQRNAALSTIFGADAMRAINIMLKEGSTAYDEMAGTITRAGAAEEAANARMKGLSGALEYFKGTLDSVLIESASPFLETLNGMVRGAADMLAGITSLSPEVQRWGVIVAVAAALAGPLLLVLGALVSAIAVLISPIGLVIAAVALLGLAWATNFGGIQEKTAAAWAVIQPVLAQVWTWLQAVIPPALATLQAAFATAWEAAGGAVSAAWGVMQPMLAEAWTWLQGQLPGALATLQALFEAAWPAISGAVSTAASGIGPTLATVQTALTGLWAGLQSVWNQVSTFLAPAIGRLGEAFQGIAPQIDALTPVFQMLVTTIGESLVQVGTAFSNLWTAIQPILGFIAAALTIIIDFGINLLASAVENLSAIATPILLQLQLTIQTMATIISEAINIIVALIDGNWATAWASAETIMATFGSFVLQTMSNLRDEITAVFGAIYSAVVDTLTDMGVDVESIITSLKGTWDNIWNSLTDAVDNVISVVEEVWTTLKDLWGWLQSHVFANPFAGWTGPNLGGATPGGDIGLHAEGTRYFEGGLTWVGEEGPELVALPRGTRIWSNEESMEMAGAGAGGAQVTIGPVYIQSEMDWEALRWRLGELVRRRGV